MTTAQRKMSLDYRFTSANTMTCYGLPLVLAFRLSCSVPNAPFTLNNPRRDLLGYDPRPINQAPQVSSENDATWRTSPMDWQAASAVYVRPSSRLLSVQRDELQFKSSSTY